MLNTKGFPHPAVTTLLGAPTALVSSSSSSACATSCCSSSKPWRMSCVAEVVDLTAPHHLALGACRTTNTQPAASPQLPRRGPLQQHTTPHHATCEWAATSVGKPIEVHGATYRRSARPRRRTKTTASQSLRPRHHLSRSVMHHARHPQTRTRQSSLLAPRHSHAPMQCSGP